MLEAQKGRLSNDQHNWHMFVSISFVRCPLNALKERRRNQEKSKCSKSKCLCDKSNSKHMLTKEQWNEIRVFLRFSHIEVKTTFDRKVFFLFVNKWPEYDWWMQTNENAMENDRTQIVRGEETQLLAITTIKLACIQCKSQLCYKTSAIFFYLWYRLYLFIMRYYCCEGKILEWHVSSYWST